MNSIAEFSQEKLTQRRQELLRSRRLKSFQAMWRALFVSGLAGGLVWVTIQPFWAIRSPEQIKIEGNQWLTTTAIRSLVPLEYPQSLFTLSPQAITEKLESLAPIAKATVTRQILPPGLSIQVKERQPVAIALAVRSLAAQVPVQRTSPSPTTAGKVGLLDSQGIWMPIDSYKPLHLPTLKVIGINKEYRQYWPEVYKAVSHSSVKVFEINWQDPANLIFKTSLGNVHLGAEISRLTYQLSVLDRMRQLPTYINTSQLAYIDLKNPDVPSIQLKKQPPVEGQDKENQMKIINESRANQMNR